MRKETVVVVWVALCLAGTQVWAEQPAARRGDATSGGGTIVAGAGTVLINEAPAARRGDTTVTPRVVFPVSCVGGPIVEGSTTVFIEGSPAARQGDSTQTVCGAETIVTGSPDVLIGS